MGGPVVLKNLAMSYFPAARGRSIIGAAELNGRVRNGDGWILRAMVARRLVVCSSAEGAFVGVHRVLFLPKSCVCSALCDAVKKTAVSCALCLSGLLCWC